MAAEYDALNASIAQWGKLTSRKLTRQIVSLTLKDKRALQKRVWSQQKNPGYRVLDKSIGSNVKKSFGQVDRINFRFRRHGIFFERGAGRNRVLGTGPRPWLFPILDRSIDELADIITNDYADAAVGEIRFLIPGIIDKKIKFR